MRWKKLVSAVLITAIIAGAGVGIGKAVKATTTSQTVPVYHAMELNYGGYYGWNSQMMQGQVTGDASQTVYVSDTEEIKSVYVTEGQAVHEGDVLMEYDTTRTSLNLQQEKLNNEKIKLRIEVAEKNIDTLSHMYPYSEPAVPDDFIPIEPDDIEEPDNKPTAKTYTVLDKDSLAVNQEIADGSIEMPLIYSCTPDSKGKVTIGTGFIKAAQEAAKTAGQKQRYIVLAIKDKNGEVTGALMADVCKMNPGQPVTVDARTGKAEATDLSQLSNEELAKALEGLDADKLTEAVKNLSPERQQALLEALKGAEPTPTPTDTPDPDDPGDPDDPSNPGGTTDPGSTTDPTNPGETTDPSEQPTPSPTPGAGGDEESITPAAYRVTEEAPVSTYADMKMVCLPDGSKVELTAFLSGEWKTNAEQAGNTLTAYGEDGGSSFNPSASGLIPSDAQYSAQELKDALADEKKQLASLQLDLKESDLKLKNAEEAVNQGVVKAKMNGIMRTVGDPENPPTDGSPFLKLTGAAGMYIVGGVYENNLSTFTEGTSVTVTSWSSGMTYTATVKSVSPYPDTSGMYGADGSNSVYPFTCYVDDPEAVLENGEWVQIQTDGSAAYDPMNGAGDKLYLYKAFIFDEGGQKYVYKEDENGTLIKQLVECGSVSGEGIEILSGLTMDEWVAFPYGKGVKEGAKCREATIDELYNS